MLDLLPMIVFADFVLKAANADEAAGKGKLLIEYYDASSAKPKTMTLDVMKEDGQWRVGWEDPQEEMELPKDGLAPAPAAAPKKEALKE